MSKGKKGKVYLVGAGPGDPGLLTIKARDCISKADVVIYDNLANRIFLDYSRSEAELIYVGKKGGSHTMGQADINRLIIEKARSGLSVVRLKGGDPFIFGRGGEEAQEIVNAGISFEVIPGITSAIAVPAYAGIPLTHRDHSATVAFITGHEDPNKARSNIDWERLSTGAGTLVFLMGIGNLAGIADKLLDNGRSPETPVAIIRQGTLSDQKTVQGRLKDIAEIAKKEDIKPPGIIIVGDVVSLRQELKWFEEKPLFGKRIVVTRAREQASQFTARLSELGAECIEFPTIKIVPPEKWDELDRAIGRLQTYNWLLFTSVNGVKYFFQRLFETGGDIRMLRDIKVGAIGPMTAGAVFEKGIRPDLVPSEYRAEAVVEAFRKEGNCKGLKILLPRASEARELLPDELKRMGASVDVAEAYRTVMPDTGTEKIKSMMEKNEIDMVTFTSSSTVTNFMGMFGKGADKISGLLKGVAIACIGPITAETARAHGLEVSLTPEDYTIEALTDAVAGYFHEQEYHGKKQPGTTE